ncbi:hypothetical protein LMG3458_02503 [Achromobacter deleyi]|uniref:Lysozyme n=1 Tax=Achromobacter deleyi TaxID=1353891 RepID=A0A6S6ZUQ9_9BURK|nr:glycoside hydrolase family protein [Achromobacter deleyi]CAB3698196.1 hypothetical protein LMG3458_02503 [Achromobacter deleyi]
MGFRGRVAVSLLGLSAAGFSAWVANEGTSPAVPGPAGTTLLAPHIPTKGDVPTVGHGSTRYEDGTRVQMSDPPITRKRAEELARNLGNDQHRCLVRTLPGVALNQTEYDKYHDFVGQFGCGNWQKPLSPRTWLLKGDYSNACAALLNWRFSAGYDCSTPGNKICRGVWTRQLERYEACTGAL